MDKIDSFYTKAFLAVVVLGVALCVILFIASLFAPKSSASGSKLAWTKLLRKRLAELEGRYPGKIGVYVKDLSSGEAIDLNGHATWYIASGVKVPVAIEVLRQIDTGQIKLNDLIEIGEDDYIDGAGQTNSLAAGSFVSIEYLLEQMLIYSDNTASDLLIRRVGLININVRLSSWSASPIFSITTLADVRRHAYAGLNPASFRLANKELRALRAVVDEAQRVREFLKLAGVDESSLRRRTLNEAFEAYYETHLNSASLEAFGQVLEKLFGGQLLSSDSTKRLISILERVETGKQRIRKGLGKGIVFAHKTGTQYARVCDFGVAWREETPHKKIIINACTRGIKSVEAAESILEAVGRAVAESGVLASADETKLRRFD